MSVSNIGKQFINVKYHYLCEEMESKKKICIGLSGGVDSSVAALLLKEKGYDVFAMYMQNWHDIEGTLHGECEWEEEKFVAEMVARKIGIPFYFIDLSKEYMSRVADYMFDEYSKGRTPNPDVLCNSQIKFDAFLKAAEKLGADMVATGHYCRKEPLLDERGKQVIDNSGNPVWRILEGSDPNKDQSYFLCQLNQEQLSKAIFPIGGLTKPQVREIARKAELQSADKKDSQGICFVGKVDLPVFLKQKLEPVEGDVVEIYEKYYESHSMKADAVGAELPFDYSDMVFETETYRSGKKHIRKTRYKEHPWGSVIGLHEGAQFYTLGQRKGLSIGGHAAPLFVISTDIKRNRVYVGEGERHTGLFKSTLFIKADEVHWIREDLAMAPGDTRRCKVRIRYRQPLQDASLKMTDGGLLIRFDQPQRSITPGQFAVWYEEGAQDHDSEMFGSGVISF